MDAIPKPLNEFNLFYILERERSLQENRASSIVDDEKDEVTHGYASGYEGLEIPPLPPRFRALRLSANWFVPRSKKKKRPHRKTHGLISFKSLASMIAKNWKTIDTDTKSFLTAVVKMKKKRYEELIIEEQNREEEKSKKMCASEPQASCQGYMMNSIHDVISIRNDVNVQMNNGQKPSHLTSRRHSMPAENIEMNPPSFQNNRNLLHEQHFQASRNCSETGFNNLNAEAIANNRARAMMNGDEVFSFFPSSTASAALPFSGNNVASNNDNFAMSNDHIRRSSEGMFPFFQNRDANDHQLQKVQAQLEQEAADRALMCKIKRSCNEYTVQDNCQASIFKSHDPFNEFIDVQSSQNNTAREDSSKKRDSTMTRDFLGNVNHYQLQELKARIECEAADHALANNIKRSCNEYNVQDNRQAIMSHQETFHSFESPDPFNTFIGVQSSQNTTAHTDSTIKHDGTMDSTGANSVTTRRPSQLIQSYASLPDSNQLQTASLNEMTPCLGSSLASLYNESYHGQKSNGESLSYFQRSDMVTSSPEVMSDNEVLSLWEGME